MRRHLLTLSLVTGLLALTACSEDGSGPKDAGLQLHDRTTAADVGLPVYPGATQRKPKEGESGNGGSVGAWVGDFGLQVHAVQFESADTPDQVAAFYADQMSREGPVLDCRHPATRAKQPEGEPERLRCDDKVPPAGHFEFRVGEAKKFRVVHIEPQGDKETRFEMVRIQIGR
ncbi:hypothetical protein [Roseateles paludis]|uniref:Lipoprotein n=1 Tax=Roseateles paludis TaxID=3145238 RepID=A0ABV0G3U2_9BURK